MRQILFTAAAAFLAGGIALGAAMSHAQPNQPLAGPPAGPPEAPPHHEMPDGAMMGHGPMGWWHGGGHDRLLNPRDFALVYPQPDRQLTPGDVQRIVEGFLLWRGNHSWKVTKVGSTAEGPIGFSLATAEGSVVAAFTMDPHTGKVVRVG